MFLKTLLRIKNYLREEVAADIISKAQYKTACSAWSQSVVRLSALFSGKYRNTRDFYQLCSELAHKKYQLETFGNEGSNQQVIADTRKRLLRLAPKVPAW